jgi:hypothetical protein
VSAKGFDQQRPDCAKERPGERPDDRDPGRHPRGHGVLPSELWMRSERRTFSREPPPNRRSGDDWKRLTLHEYLCQVAPAAIRQAVARHPDYVASNQGRLMSRIAGSGLMKEIIAAAAKLHPAGDPYPAISSNYVHKTRGLRRGRLEYAVKQGFGQFMLLGETAAGEMHTLRVNDLGTHESAVAIQGNRDKVFRLVVHNKLGAGRDYLRLTIDGIPLAGGGEVKINVKPGIGGVELTSAGQPINAKVEFDYLRRGARLRSAFELKEKDGLRFVPSTFITANELKVSRIDTLFGDALESRLVKPMP